HQGCSNLVYRVAKTSGSRSVSLKSHPGPLDGAGLLNGEGPTMHQPADQPPARTPDLVSESTVGLAAGFAPWPPEPFTDLVRDALLHLYDPAQLQSHPLVAVASGGEAGSSGALTAAGAHRSGAAGLGGRMLRQALLDAIDALQPGPGVAATSRPWRAYRILELRYLGVLDVADVIGRVALSKSQYHREH